MSIGHQDFSEQYHAARSADATVADSISKALLSGSSTRQLLRSNSIQDELQSTFN